MIVCPEPKQRNHYPAPVGVREPDLELDALGYPGNPLGVQENDGGYDTTINVVGGIRDYSLVFKVISADFEGADSVQRLIHTQNGFNLRTAKSRNRIEAGINKAFLSFKNWDHQVIIKRLFQSDIPPGDKNLVLFWHFALNNRLFREISVQVFAKLFYSGRVSIHKNDIIAYLKDCLRSEGAAGVSWSESTVNTLATKYLNFMALRGSGEKL